MNKTDWLANLIKVAAILTAAPRWVGALLGAEGFSIPSEWLVWWVPVSAVLSAGMALVEGLAFAYVFEAWRNQQDKDGDKLFWFAMLSALIFVAVLAPYIAASVQGAQLSAVLSAPIALYAWLIAVGLSTIAIVASVGYAQKRKASAGPRRVSADPAQPTAHTAPAEAAPAHPCPHCPRSFASQQALAAHLKTHLAEKERKNGHTAQKINV